MNTVRRIVKNTGVILLYQAMGPLCSFILVLYIGRLLGVSGLGKFSIALSLFFIFQTISSLGFEHLITREVAKDKTKASKYLINASFIGFFFSTLMAGVMCLTGYLLNYSPDTAVAVYILSFSLIPATLAIVCQSICRAYERLEFVSLPIITGDLFKVLLGLYILFKGYGLVELMVVVLGSHLLTLSISSYFVFRSIGKPLLKIDFGFCKWIVKTTPTFALIFIFSTIYWNVDVLMISKLKGATEVGFYSAAYKLMTACRIVPMGYIAAIQPVIFRLFKFSREKFEMVCKKSIKYIFIATLPIAVGITILADRFIGLFFKSEFLASTDALRILIWTLVPFSTVLVFAYALIASNNQKIDLRINIVGLICNVSLNLLLIPNFGFLGAAIATFVSICLFLSLQYFFISTNLFRLNFIQIAGKPIISATMMGMIILLFNQVNLFMLVFVSALVYIFFLLVLRTFSQTDIQLFGRLWKREEGPGFATKSELL